MTSASEILREVADIVDGVRGDTHGPRERSFGIVADLWSAYLGQPVTAADVAWMMALLKIGRAKAGQPIKDHSADCAGYAALAGELGGA